jgi:hypothetical protein
VKVDWSSALDGPIKLTTSLTFWDDKGKGKSKQICDLVLPWYVIPSDHQAAIYL